MDKTPQNSIPNNVKGRIIFFVALAAILGTFWYVTRPDSVKAPNGDGQIKNTAIGGEIAYIEGAVEYKKSGGEWTRATVNTTLAQGDSVEVVGAGKVIINLDDGSAIRLNKDSAITLTSLAGDHFVITNDKGQVYTRVVKSDRIFEVASAGATYQSVGTAYKTVNEEKLKGVEVYESKVKILGASEKEILVEQGNKYYVLNTANKKAEKTFVKISSADVAKDEFLSWNKTEDIKLNEAEADTTATADVTEDSGKIILTAKQVSGGISLTWTADGVDAPNGFKVVKSTQIDPVYPGNDYYYASNPDTRSYKWSLNDGKTYFFRVCQYIDGVCKAYSNNIKVTAPKVVETETEASTGPVSSLTIASAGTGKVTWKISGYSEQGFKLVWSKNSGPTYPTRSGDKYNYYSDSGTRSGTIDAFSGNGTYYVRVCEYLGGKCGKYSNQITMTLGEVAEQSNDVSSITISSLGNGQVLWRVSGYSESGFKVVWSKNSGPTYPTRDGDKYDYLSDPKATSDTIDAFDGEGVYYVRVCEYLGGRCGVYSNQIQVSL